MNDNLPVKSEFLVYQTEDGRVKLDVRLENETVWLTQQLMADLFQTTQQNISLHIRNIYVEGELIQESTHKKYLSVQPGIHLMQCVRPLPMPSVTGISEIPNNWA